MSGDSRWAKWILGKKQERENIFKVIFSLFYYLDSLFPEGEKHTKFLD